MTKSEQLKGVTRGLDWRDLAAALYVLVAVVMFGMTLRDTARFVWHRWGPAERDSLPTLSWSAVDVRCPRVSNDGVATDVHDFDVPDNWKNGVDAIECFGNEAGLEGEGWDSDLIFTPRAMKGHMTAIEALTRMLDGTPAAVYGTAPSGRSIYIVPREDIPRFQAEDAARAEAAAMDSKTH